jgi:hypothetical protein
VPEQTQQELSSQSLNNVAVAVANLNLTIIELNKAVNAISKKIDDLLVRPDKQA